MQIETQSKPVKSAMSSAISRSSPSRSTEYEEHKNSRWRGKVKRMLSVVSVAWGSLPAISGDLCSVLNYAFPCIQEFFIHFFFFLFRRIQETEHVTCGMQHNKKISYLLYYTDYVFKQDFWYIFLIKKKSLKTFF